MVVKPLEPAASCPRSLRARRQRAPVDEPTGDPSTVLQLLHEMTRAGYSVMRAARSPARATLPASPARRSTSTRRSVVSAAPREAAPLRLRGHEPRLHLRSQLGGVERWSSPRRRRCAACGSVRDDSDPVGGVSRGQRASPNAPRSFGRPRGAGDEEPQPSDFLHEVFRKDARIPDALAERADFKPIVDDYWPDRMQPLRPPPDYYRQLDGANIAGGVVGAWKRQCSSSSASWTTPCRGRTRSHIAQIVNSKRPGHRTCRADSSHVPRFNIRDSVQQTLDSRGRGR